MPTRLTVHHVLERNPRAHTNKPQPPTRSSQRTLVANEKSPTSHGSQRETTDSPDLPTKKLRERPNSEEDDNVDKDDKLGKVIALDTFRKK